MAPKPAPPVQDPPPRQHSFQLPRDRYNGQFVPGQPLPLWNLPEQCLRPHRFPGIQANVVIREAFQDLQFYVAEAVHTKHREWDAMNVHSTSTNERVIGKLRENFMRVEGLIDTMRKAMDVWSTEFKKALQAQSSAAAGADEDDEDEEELSPELIDKVMVYVGRWPPPAAEIAAPEPEAVKIE